MEAVTVFSCGNCRRSLSADLREVPLPPPVTEEEPGIDRFLPPWLPRGAYAANPDTDEFALHPDDVCAMSTHPDLRRCGGCCGLDGVDGPNLVCDNCGAEVATRYSDCWSQQYIGLVPQAVTVTDTSTA
jgi:hypothetical protein